MKKCENPLILEITKTHKGRTHNLSDLMLPQGVYKKCVWCLKSLSGTGRRRWCSDECVESATAWGFPQKDHGLAELLVRQDFKCNICAFDYGTVVEEMFNRVRTTYGLGTAEKDWRTKPSYWISVRIKEYLHAHDLPHRLEVDHILAISKGGESIGLDNHQAICYACHKTKTKIDNSGPRKKKVDKSTPVDDTKVDENNG